MSYTNFNDGIFIDNDLTNDTYYDRLSRNSSHSIKNVMTIKKEIEDESNDNDIAVLKNKITEDLESDACKEYLKRVNDKISTRSHIEKKIPYFIDNSISRDVFKSTKYSLKDGFYMDNNLIWNNQFISTKSCLINSEIGQFCIPSNCSFFNANIFENKIFGRINKKFSCLIVDPPWNNRSVKRSHSYKMADYDEICKLDIGSVLEDDSLVFIWLTNSPTCRYMVLNYLLPSWNLIPFTMLVWFKLTTDGKLIFNIDSKHMKPFEICLIAKKYQLKVPVLLNVENNNYQTRKMAVKRKLNETKSSYIKKVVKYDNPLMCPIMKLFNLQISYRIYSYQFISHSKKPILKTFIDKNFPQYSNSVMEIFARNLVPSWTSIGDQVLMFQSLNHCFQ